MPAAVLTDVESLAVSERDMLGTYLLTPDAFRRAAGPLPNDRMDVQALVTPEVGLDGIPGAFERMARNDGLTQLVSPGR